MYRLLLLISLVPISLSLVARWWFGQRVLVSEGKLKCRCDLARWYPSPGDEALVHRAEDSAAEFGRQLRLKALAEWRAHDPKAAASRENARRFGLAVPPLSVMIALFAVLVSKVPVLGGIAIVIGATALAAAIGILTLAPELQAIAKTARRTRESNDFPNPAEAEAVTRCAIAHAWNASLPPILRWIHG
jgi:hypothetical protein